MSENWTTTSSGSRHTKELSFNLDIFPTPFEAKFPSLPDDTILFPLEFPYGAPVNSTICGSSEIESDKEEQLVAELTRSSLQPDTKSVSWFVIGSPQYTLCAFKSGCGCGKRLSQGSRDGVCKLSSVKTTCDQLHAATGEVERLRLKQEGYAFNHQNGNLIPQRKPSPIIKKSV